MLYSLGQYAYFDGSGISLNISAPTDQSQYSMMGLGEKPTEIVTNNLQTILFTSSLFQQVPSDLNQDGTGFEERLQALEEYVLESMDDIDINETVINDQNVAYGVLQTTIIDEETANLIFAMNIAENSIITMTMLGEPELVEQYESTILAIAETMSFTPPTVEISDNDELPLVYRGNIGMFQQGELTFNYPDDWYLLEFVNVFLQNVPQRLNDVESGQFQASFIDPFSNLIFTEVDMENITDCELVDNLPDGITALSLAEAQTTVSEEERELLQEAGRTFTTPETVTIDDKEISFVRAYQDDIESLTLLLDVGDGLVVSLNALSPRGEMEQYEDQLFAVMATVEYTPLGCEEGEAN